MADQRKVGMRVRTYREAMGMSVEALAKKCSLTVEAIHAIENGSVPSANVLARICRAVGQRSGAFTDDQCHPGPVVMRAGDAKPTEPSHGGMVGFGAIYKPLAAAKTDRHMDPYIIELAAYSEVTPICGEGETFFMCNSGEVEFSQGEETITLKPGDTIYFNRTTRHTIRALGGHQAQIYCIIYMPA